jgi:WhiB family redox-sensing transcriptional regulator
VRAHCRQAARENHEYGYWAGESEEDRHLAGYTVTAPIGVRARLAKAADACETG